MLRNLTLSAMHPDDLAALLPDLSEHRVERGDVLNRQGEVVEHVYFPTTAYLANTLTFRDGRSAETFSMGLEGVSGLAPFMADTVCAWAVEVKISGLACRTSARALRSRTEVSPTLRQQLIRLLSEYQTQASVGVACAALHDSASRLARFMLVHTEERKTSELRLTQEDIAALLGLQRTTINAAAVELKHAGAINYRRGAIWITNADILKRHACECYALQQNGWAAAEEPLRRTG